MPTTFNVVSLGTVTDSTGATVIIDPIDGSGDLDAENASQLVGLTFGGPDGDFLTGENLFNRFAVMSQGQPGFNSGTNNIYDQDNDPDERFRIDGGPSQVFDAVATYNATITYWDGTTATISAVIFQDVNGNTYWAPEINRLTDGDQEKMEAGPIMSLTLDSLISNTSTGLVGNRQEWEFAPCFASGTRLLTEGGLVRIEELGVGDKVLTSDNGYQAILWIGRNTVPATGKLAPVHITAGALGNGLPSQDLVVSRQHRMLVNSKICQRMFGTCEVLIPAIKLTALPGIYVREDLDEVTYLHLRTSRHDIIFAEGTPTETLYLGPFAIEALGAAAVAELEEIFPDLRTVAEQPARILVDGKRAKTLVARHDKNALSMGRPPEGI